MAIQNFSWVIPDKLAGSAMPGKSILPEDAYIFSDLKELYDRGVRCLLSLKRMPETFSRLCKDAGMEWISFPIPDFGIPSDLASYERIIRKSVKYLENGTPLCVHCYAGIGRTGIALACIVGIYFSISGYDAINKIRYSRPAVETDEQIAFITDFLNRN